MAAVLNTNWSKNSEHSRDLFRRLLYTFSLTQYFGIQQNDTSEIILLQIKSADTSIFKVEFLIIYDVIILNFLEMLNYRYANIFSACGDFCQTNDHFTQWFD